MSRELVIDRRHSHLVRFIPRSVAPLARRTCLLGRPHDIEDYDCAATAILCETTDNCPVLCLICHTIRSRRVEPLAATLSATFPEINAASMPPTGRNPLNNPS